ncbi:MAG: bifunctional glutamate N-acetyltransferase/amino-acid acetyltransferase ArgJ, partial [Planctomycetaceae bacterium]
MSDCVLPRGFQTAGIACGIKQDGTRHDLALFVSDPPCVAAGVFTQNRVVGAPVHVSRARVPGRSVRGVIINSGNANACTGERGLEDARWMTTEAARRLGCDANDVLVCSTGVIGRFLPRDRLAAGIPQAVAALADTPGGFENAARAMMTTDTVPKQSVREIDIAGRTVRVSGAAKGAAMIAPNMATMLAVIMTDAELEPDEADAMLRHAVDQSFNCISVEGHTSTSDTVLLLANGAAQSRGVPPRTGPARPGSDRAMLQHTLDEVCCELAQMIIRDAEGAGHFITIDVRGLRRGEEAHRVAKAVADSPLVKTAIAGADPNWGRIVSAAGYAGVAFAERDLSLRLNGIPLYESGAPIDHDDAAVSASLRDNRDVHIELDFLLGEAAVRFWTCDLTAEYVRLNSEYT